MSEREPLTTLMASGPMRWEDVLRIGRHAVDALRTIHGELWPSTVCVGEEAVEILPPGGTERSRYGQYAAPERLLGQAATAQSDVFSLGAILFHALVGRPPFRGDTAAEVMLSACADKPLDVHAFRKDVPRELEQIITRCLAREPSERYASLTELGRALDGAAPREVKWPGRRILIADDDAPVRDLHSHIAARVGVDADIVATGRDAIAAFKSQRYDLALLDLHMPRLSGWEVLDFLRAHRHLRPAKIFVITGFSDQSISEADREIVTAVLYKPVAAEELRKLITLSLAGESMELNAVLQVTGHQASAARSSPTSTDPRARVR